VADVGDGIRGSVEQLLAEGEMARALKLLERARLSAVQADDVLALTTILGLADQIAARAEGGHRGQAERVGYAAQQNIRFVSRKAALAGGNAWRDPFAAGELDSDPALRPREPVAASEPEASVPVLVGLLVASVGGGVAVWLVLLTVYVLAGGDGPRGHRLYPHSAEVILWIAAVLAGVCAAGSTLWWLSAGGLAFRRFVIALPLAAVALASVAALASYAYGQAPPDPRPANVTLPAISGIPRAGLTLRAHVGTWKSDPGDCLAGPNCERFSFQWQRCDARGLHCQPIRGGKTELETPDLIGYRLRVAVTAENDAGARTAQSQLTAVVARA
jgi:hypothetical protein